jgi:hypothetical protein
MLLTVVFVKKGGRVEILAVTPTIEQQFLTVISEHTAGCPQQGIRWTNLKQQEIADAMSELADGDVSRYLVRQLLKKHGFVKRSQRLFVIRRSRPPIGAVETCRRPQ